MSKFEKLMCVILVAALGWYFFFNRPSQKTEVAQKAEAPAAVEQKSESKTLESAPIAPVEAPKTIDVPEQTVTLENDELILTLSSHGAAIKKATLKKYAEKAGEISDENPAIQFDFSRSPLGKIGGDDSLAGNYEIREVNTAANYVLFANAEATRKVSLLPGYQVVFDEKFDEPRATATTLSLGVMQMGASKNDLLSVDSFARDAGKGKSGVLHHSEGSSPLKSYLVSGSAGGCSGSSSAAGMPLESRVQVFGAQSWIAAKNRFFVTALANSSTEAQGFFASVARDATSATYRPTSLAIEATFQNLPETRKSVFYVGPKKQSLLWDLGMRDVMEFGMWRYLCYPLVWVLNLFNNLIPNFGVAIILLTLLVRVLFWPLTHQSTVGMKKMQEIQPLLKELQTKFKDNPQRLQQETWALYKNNKVNPLSSCLPMLVQIPVFIALFNVLRAAVELRYAPFLWISDLSEPEALFSAYLPFGGLNILPILMAITTALQSYFTPSAGDKNQQKMMMVMMPLMMLFFFYNFPSALSLYWLLSNIASIIQMAIIRARTKTATLK